MRREVFHDGTEVSPGYSRAVRVGPQVFVAGTTSLDAAGKPRGSSVYEQACICFDKIEAALATAGAAPRHVVRLVIYVTDIASAGEVTRALAERYGGIDPAATLLAVSALVDPALRIEIAADAVVTPEG